MFSYRGLNHITALLYITTAQLTVTRTTENYLQELNCGAAGGGLVDPPNPPEPKAGVDPEAIEPKVGPLAADPDPNCPKAPPVLVGLEEDIIGF